MAPEGGRHAASDVWSISKVALLPARYLTVAEREEIALLRAQGFSVREVAQRLGRVASTNSRELRRNAATRSGGLEYRAATAQAAARRRAARPLDNLVNAN
jgi:IS30 family transposase